MVVSLLICRFRLLIVDPDVDVLQMHTNTFRRKGELLPRQRLTGYMQLGIIEGTLFGIFEGRWKPHGINVLANIVEGAIQSKRNVLSQQLLVGTFYKKQNRIRHRLIRFVFIKTDILLYVRGLASFHT